MWKKGGSIPSFSTLFLGYLVVTASLFLSQSIILSESLPEIRIPQ